MIITCGDEKLHVHKFVVCSRSSWFQRAVGGSSVSPLHIVVSYKDSLYKKVKVLDMSDEDITVLRSMISYLYTLTLAEPDFGVVLQDREKGVLTALQKGIFDDGAVRERALDSPPTLFWTYLLSVYRIANKYGVSGLKDLSRKCFEDFSSSILKDLPVVVKKRPLSKRGLIRRVRSPSDYRRQGQFHFDHDFVELMRQLYTDENIDDREKMRNAILNRVYHCVGNRIRTDIRLQKLMRGVPAFAIDLAAELAAKLGPCAA